ncbi:bacillithiol system redox-active protein YtxJ [Rhodothermus marinus]|uniref:bacillithiol system redox-active protein YtxJ n=1 Tax=Rhodothermus marinus TaxID=29549 RepID=UPI0012BA396A|nr:bacillithiol system redox-active protein YtxJ [Rhodothermus marinus]BBM70220.1 general stress protein [Rhodothermus marinus]BBM73207.1 general stress protein [Rhodothermus marinus]
MRPEVPDLSLTPLTDEAGLDAALAHSYREPILLFKHSRWCGISHRVREDVLRVAAARSVPLYEVVVQTARPVSDAIARRLGIRHETPQAFVIYQGQVFFHASHYAITPDALNKTLDQLDCAGSSAE